MNYLHTFIIIAIFWNILIEVIQCEIKIIIKSSKVKFYFKSKCEIVQLDLKDSSSSPSKKACAVFKGFSSNENFDLNDRSLLDLRSIIDLCNGTNFFKQKKNDNIGLLRLTKSKLDNFKCNYSDILSNLKSINASLAIVITETDAKFVSIEQILN